MRELTEERDALLEKNLAAGCLVEELTHGLTEAQADLMRSQEDN